MFIWKITSCLLLILCLKFEQNDGYRLPTTVVPEKYDLKILTYLDEGGNEDFTFSGTVKIKIKCVEPTKTITLNAKELIIETASTTLREENSKNEITISKGENDDENDFYKIYLNDSINKDSVYELTIDFRGKLTESLKGFYSSNYLIDGKKRWLAVTQFEPTYARRAFPCFDEPSFKAKFTITLGHSSRFNALSNMPLESKEIMKDKEGWEWSKFNESVKMSTYLVAFVVSDFVYKEPQKLYKTAFKIWARKNAVNQTTFASEVGPQSLEYFEKYFNLEYPLPKQDMIAIPDFSAGAMENWGLITYRETAILYDENAASAYNKYSIMNTITHELAHQWFGNLVTMKWWTDLWLNEGFATYMANLAVNNFYPNWNVLDYVTVDNLHKVFALDSLQSSHPVSVPIKNSSEILEIFDTISYRKGCFILRMMDLFLGNGVLQNGVSKYLKEHAYSNAEQDDLWNALTTEAHDKKTLPTNMTVKEIMDTWTVQTGYPVLTVKRSYSDKDKMTITQERYFKNKTEQLSHKPQCWWVPLTYTTKEAKDFKNTKPKQWLSCDDKDLVVENLKPDSWVIINIRAGGLYRVNYDLKNWKMLTEFLHTNFEDIHVLNRVLLIEDSMSLASSGYLDYNIPFDLLTYLKKEKEYLPWKTALLKIGALKNQFKRTPDYGLFQSYRRELLKNAYQEFGGLQIAEEKREKLDAVQHQVLIAAASCASQLPECLADASKLFEKWMAAPEKPNPIPQDMRSTVYCQGIEQGSEEEWNFLWDQYKKSNVGTEKSTILHSLACTKKVWLLSRYLNWSFNESTAIRKQDTYSIFSAVASNEVGFFVAKSFLEENLEQIFEWVPSKKLSKYAKAITGEITTKRQQEMFLKFLKQHPTYFDQSSLKIQQGIELMNINVDWNEKYYGAIKNILQKKNELIPVSSPK